MPSPLRYKFIEVTPVSDLDLEEAINPVVADGWQLDAIHFVMREASYRPVMAFVSFVRRDDEGSAEDDGNDSAG